LAGGAAAGTGLAGAMDHARALLAGLVGAASPPPLQALLDWLGQGRPIALYDSS
jgi:hypothetical protein